MIIDFTVRNFRSIRTEQTVSFLADLRTTHLADHVAHPVQGKLGLLKSIGLYGANASGKSNLLLAFDALRYIVRETADLKEGEPILCYEPYLLAEETKTAPVSLEIEFFTPPKNIRYRYAVTFTQSRIVNERLSFFPSAKEAMLFSRSENDTWETIKFGTLFKGGSRKLPFFANNSYLSKAGNSADSPEMIQGVYNYIRKHIRRLGLNKRILISDWPEDKKLFGKVSSLLALVDTGVEKIDVVDTGIDANSVKLPEAMPESLKSAILRDMKREYRAAHRTDSGTIQYFDLDEESDGTKKLFHLAPIAISIMQKGGVLIVDELDNSMHPFMAELIVKLFNDPEVNPGRAQLIFSTHNINLMSPERLRRDQIWFAEKARGETTFFSLDDFDKKKVKPTSPFTQWYAEGRFDAVPNIDYRGIANLLTACEAEHAEK